jgi:signal transduction histidine kinase
LHIVKRYLDLLGGEVNLKSEIGKGTIITFTIPVKYS